MTPGEATTHARDTWRLRLARAELHALEQVLTHAQTRLAVIVDTGTTAYHQAEVAAIVALAAEVSRRVDEIRTAWPKA